MQLLFDTLLDTEATRLFSTEQFSSSCKCLSHDQRCSNNNEKTVKIKTSKKFNVVITEDLKRQNLLLNRAGFLCYKCYEEVST